MIDAVVLVFPSFFFSFWIDEDEILTWANFANYQRHLFVRNFSPIYRSKIAGR